MDLDRPADSARALAQQWGLTEVLNRIGVPVLSLGAREGAPDCVFPNNVFGTIPGRFIVGAMRFDNRRMEADRGDIRALFDRFGYESVDLSCRDLVAELTGPLILDRSRGVGFCGMTGRVDDAGCQAMHQAFDLRLSFQFDLQPDEYHTNVVMSVLSSRACVLHPGSFADPEVPEAIVAAFGPDHCLVLEDEQKLAFAGNCLAVTGSDVIMSAVGVDSLSSSQRRFFVDNGFQLHSVDVSELEKAGGSVRCMMCEVF